MKNPRQLFLLGGIIFGVLSAIGLTGCVSPVPRDRPVYSARANVDYEHGKFADRIRVSPGFWTGPETFGWMEVHYFKSRVTRPGGVVGSTVWLVEYDERTGERSETLYWAPRDRISFFLDWVRYSEGIFVHIGSRHYSEVIEKGKGYFISPGNNMNRSDETGLHKPYDFAHGLHLSSQTFFEEVGTCENGAPMSRITGIEVRLFDVQNQTIVERIPVRDVRLLPTNNLEARLIDPDTIFFCRPYIERAVGDDFRVFEFYLFRIPERELVPYGSVRVRAHNYLGWDVSPSANFFVAGAVDVPTEPGRNRPRPTIVWMRTNEPSSTEVAEWEVFTELPFGGDPVFSPDGRRIGMSDRGAWGKSDRGINRYFEDENPLIGFRFYEIEK